MRLTLSQQYASEHSLSWDQVSAEVQASSEEAMEELAAFVGTANYPNYRLALTGPSRKWIKRQLDRLLLQLLQVETGDTSEIVKSKVSVTMTKTDGGEENGGPQYTATAELQGDSAISGCRLSVTTAKKKDAKRMLRYIVTPLLQQLQVSSGNTEEDVPPSKKQRNLDSELPGDAQASPTSPISPTYSAGLHEKMSKFFTRPVGELPAYLNPKACEVPKLSGVKIFLPGQAVPSFSSTGEPLDLDMVNQNLLSEYNSARKKNFQNHKAEGLGFQLYTHTPFSQNAEVGQGTKTTFHD